MIEEILKQRMNIVGCSASFLAAVDGNVSKGQLSEMLRGLKKLDNVTAERLLRLLDDLARLKRFSGPIPIALENPVVIRRLLEAQANGELSALIRDALNEAENKQ